jgi:outer membrane autotransporter protein
MQIKNICKNRVLTLAVMATLLAGGTTFAASATDTVHSGNDKNDPYSSITVDQESNYMAGAFATVAGVVNETTNSTLDLHVNDGAEINVTNNGHYGNKNFTDGVYSAGALNVDNAVKINVSTNIDENDANCALTGRSVAAGALIIGGGNVSLADGTVINVNATRNAKATNTSAEDDAFGVFAYGHRGSNILTLGNNVTINSNITSNALSHNMGISAIGDVVLGNNDAINVTTKTSGDAAASAVGIFGDNSNLTAGSGTTVKIDATADNLTSATAVNANENCKFDIAGLTTIMNVNSADTAYRPHVASIWADEGGVVNVNQGTNNAVKLEGDIITDSGTVNVNFNTKDSYLQGNIYSQGSDDTGVNATFANGATWKPVFDNRYGSLNVDANDHKNVSATTDELTEDGNITLNGGVIDLTWDNPTRSGDYRTLNLDDVSGTDGTFVVNTDLAKGLSDKINLGSNCSLGTANVDVKYDPYLAKQGLGEGSKLNGNVNVFGGEGASKLTKVNGVEDTYNLYDYTPDFAQNSDGSWSLTGLSVDPQEKASRAVRMAGEDGLSLNSMWLAETNNMQARMGELRATKPAKAGLWARWNNGKVEQADSSVQYNMLQGGIDKESKGAHERTYRGFAVSHATGSSDFALGSGDLSETSLSLYQTGIKNNGFYYDVIAKAGKYNNDYDITESANKSGGDYSTWSYGISGEVGVRKDLGHGVYVEPQAELILGHINGSSYTTDTGMNTDINSQNKAITRLGVAVGKEFKGGNIYGRASYYHDFSGGVNMDLAADGNSMSYSPDMAHNWGVLSLGGNIKAGKNCNVYGEVSKYVGQLSGRPTVNMGVRWTF